MTDTVHFSTLLKRSLCGKQGNYTGDPTRVTCERCKQRLEKATAVEVDLWALDAAENVRFGKPKPTATPAHVRELFALSFQRREQEITKAMERVDYAKEELEQMKKHLLGFETELATAMDGM